MAFNPIKEDKKEEKISIEYIFSEQFKNNKDFTAFKESETEAAMYQWSINHWSRIDMLKSKNIAYTWLEGCNYLGNYNEKTAINCIKTYTTIKSVSNNVKEIEKNRIIVPLQNYWLEIKEDGVIEYFKPDRNYKITYSLDINANGDKLIDKNYVPSKELRKESEWQKFLDSSIPDKDVQKTLQEYVGYTLIPNVDLQVALFCEGEGSNGKGVFFEVVSALHQKEKVNSIKLEKLDGFSLTPLIDSSLLIVPECGKTINEEMFKCIVSGDPIAVNRKNRDEITIKPIAKLLISCNLLPTIKDQTDGVTRRMICVEWTKKFKGEEKDTGLSRRIIQNELEEVLDWALNGLIEILKRDKKAIFIADAIKKKKDNHIYDTDSIAQWIEEEGIVLNENSNNDEYLQKSKVYINYVDYCNSIGILPKGDVNFWKEIKRKFSGFEEIRKYVIDGGVKKQTRFVNLNYNYFFPNKENLEAESIVLTKEDFRGLNPYKIVEDVDDSSNVITSLIDDECPFEQHYQEITGSNDKKKIEVIEEVQKVEMNRNGSRKVFLKN